MNVPSQGLVQLVYPTKHGFGRNLRITQTSAGYPLVVMCWKHPACTHFERRLTESHGCSQPHPSNFEGQAMAPPQPPVFGVTGYRGVGGSGGCPSHDPVGLHDPSGNLSCPDWFRGPRAPRPISSRYPPYPRGVVPTTPLIGPSWTGCRSPLPRANRRVVRCGLRPGTRHRGGCRAS